MIASFRKTGRRRGGAPAIGQLRFGRESAARAVVSDIPRRFNLDMNIIFGDIPYIILLTAVIPVTRHMDDTAAGIVPQVFGTVPFLTRHVETALAEVVPGLIEAAQAMGTSPWQIVWWVLLKERVPGIVRGTTINIVSLVGVTAIAWTVDWW